MTRGTTPLRILVTGSRTWTDAAIIAAATSDYLRCIGTRIGGAWPFPIVVHGTACGADQIARDWGWTPEPHPADWDRHRRSAGYRRNAEMVRGGTAVCLAFIHQHSPGATHTATLAERAGIPTRR